MSAMAGSKRSAADHGASQTKRSKTTVGQKRLAAISDALSEAKHISKASRMALTAVVPSALGTPLAARDDHLKAMIDIIGKALDGHEVALQAAVEAASDAVAEVAQSTEDCAAKTEDLEVQLAAKGEEVLAKAAQKKEDVAMVGKCTSEHGAAQVAHGKRQEELADAAKNKALFEKVAAEAFATLRDNSSTTDKRILRKHIAVLEKTVEPLKLGEALLAGIPVTLTKPVDKRGPYDHMLVDFLSQVLAEEVAKNAASIEAGDKEAAAAVQTTKEALDAAQEAQATITGALSAAEAEKADLAKQIKALKQEAVKLRDRTEAADMSKTAKEKELADFRLVLQGFVIERDGESGAPAGGA